MQADPTRALAADRHAAREEWSNEEQPQGWQDADGGPAAAKQRLARLARTIEADVIPRLVRAHRPAAANPTPGSAVPTAHEAETFVQQILNDSETSVSTTLSRLRERGVSVESLYVDLFGPTARALGVMWEDDLCDFSTVTVALGRLQRLLRDLSPAFGSEVEHPANGRRALFVQPRHEQHSFGLSMVAEFFRRDGWDVMGGVGGAVTDPAGTVRTEWVDAVGFSVGSDQRLAWLKETIAAVRAASRNTHLVVLVGGPLFSAQPGLAAELGADGTARNGKDAPTIAEQLLSRVAAQK